MGKYEPLGAFLRGKRSEEVPLTFSEIEKITGKCAGGKVEIRARGLVSKYDGHNYLFVRSFETVAAK